MPPQVETPLPPETVLVVDDEDVIRHVFERLLPSAELQVRSAASGEEAVELLKTQRFGCLLVDKNLPGIDGLEVMRVARRLQPGCACLIMTGYSSTGSAVEALRVGASDYLEKPFDDLELVLAKIRAAMGAARADHERRRLQEQVRRFQEELDEKKREALSQRSALDTLDAVIEARVREATADLRGKNALLESCLRSSAGIDAALELHTRFLLDLVRQTNLGEAPGAAAGRALLARVTRQLASNLELITRARELATQARPTAAAP